MTPAERRAAFAKLDAKAAPLLARLDLERRAGMHEAKARALECWREASDPSLVSSFVLSENRRREAEHKTEAVRLNTRAKVMRR